MTNNMTAYGHRRSFPSTVLLQLAGDTHRHTQPDACCLHVWGGEAREHPPENA